MAPTASFPTPDRIPPVKRLKRLFRQVLAPPLGFYGRYAPVDVGKEVLLRRVVLPALEEAPRERVVTTRHGLRMRVRTSDYIQRHILALGVWEPNLTAWLRRSLRPGDVFVDVGANVGYFALHAARWVTPGGSVVAIEASPTIYQMLRDQVALNRLTNVRAVHAAVAGAPGRLMIYRGPEENIGLTATTAGEGFVPEGEVPAMPLGDLLRPEEIERTAVIKIDVEGAELDVVRGMQSLLPRLRPDVRIVCEVAPDRLAARQEGADELLAIMRGAGFRAYDLENSYSIAGMLRGLRRGPALMEITGPLTRQSDLVFLRGEPWRDCLVGTP